MDPICYGFPPIIPSSRHTVLFEIPIPVNGGTLKPFPLTSSQEMWDNSNVKMPHSSSHVHNVTRQKIWDIVHEKLGNPPKNFRQLKSDIMSFNQCSEEETSFSGLKIYIEEDLSTEERDHFFKSLLPKIISLALSLPDEITQPIPLLTKGSTMSISLSQKQIGILLANAFLCTFPRRPTDGDKCGTGEYPDINFNRLYDREDVHNREKFKCIFNYFDAITTSDHKGSVTFTKQSPDLIDFEVCNEPLQPIKLEPTGVIEEADNHLQVDFADKYVGGMIFTKGCVQEEIRFLQCPELIISRLFTAALSDEDALIISGVEQYNKTKGYARSFKFDGPFNDVMPRDKFGRITRQVVAIDALSFSRRKNEQYKPQFILREIQKAYAGFLPEAGTLLPYMPVATGNWGCGVFQGNPMLKSLIQLIAATTAGRSIKYHAFGNKKLVLALGSLSSYLQDCDVSSAELTKVLLSYDEGKMKPKGYDLYDYIRLKIQERRL